MIDPKAMSKQALYGVLDPNTREWRDGLFTAILRKIIDNVRGEINKRQWYAHIFSNFSCRSRNPNYFFDLRNLQEQVKNILFQKLYCPFAVGMNRSSDLKVISKFLQILGLQPRI